jgi:RNA polymerase sigma-70 factor (ECF subfamily)
LPGARDYTEVSSRQPTFRDILREHEGAIGRVVASYARPADQDDLAQDIAVALWNALPSFRGDASLRTFVFRVAHNRGLSHLARRRARGEPLEEAEDGAPGPEARASGREEVLRLFAAVRRLPVPQRQALTLAMEELSHADIAMCLGISVGNVAVRLTRARATLRQELERP